MNLLLFHPSELSPDNRLFVSGERAARLAEICRLGDELRVGEIGGKLGSARVSRIEGCSITLDVAPRVDTPPVNPVTLVVALPRPQMLKRILELAGTLSVKRVCLIRTARVERSFFSSTVLRDAERFLRLGMEQGITTVLPELRVADRFRCFVEDLLPEMKVEQRIVFQPGAGRPNLRQLLRCPDEEVVAAIGPEGGFVDFELEILSQNGFAAASLGPAVLRVETAVTFALAQLGLLRTNGNMRGDA